MGFITLLRPNSPVPEIATTLSHATTQARTLLAAVLQATKQPGMPMVTLVTTSHEESWRMPAPRQTHDALLMLLLTPHEGLHPRLEAALLAIVVENLQDLSRTAKQRPGVIEAMKAMTAALSTGCTLEEAYGSVPAAQRDALWQGGPYSGGDPASDLLLNYLALFQGKVIEMALNSRQYACTDYPQLPKGFDQKQASLEDRLRQVETPALTSEYLIQYRQLNQSLYRQEWFVQLPVSVAQQMSNWLLRYSLPSTAVARQLINYCQGQVSAQALGEQWQTIWSQLQQASTLREFLEGVNKALEQGVLTPVTVLYGLSNLSSTAVPLIPVSLMVAAMVGWGQEKFAGWLRDYVGSPSSEATRTLQELGRLAGNCASLKQYAQPALSSLDEWLNPASVPLGITQAVDNPGVRAQSNADKHLLEQGGAERWGHGLPPGVTEPPATSNGARPTGIMQAAQHAVKHVVSSALSLLWKTSSSDVCEKTDVETPLCPAHGAVYQPTTAPMAAAVQHWPAGTTGLGLGAAGVTVLTGTYGLYRFMTGAPDPIPPPSEPVWVLNAAQQHELMKALKNQLHGEPKGELSSAWDGFRTMRDDAARTGNTSLSEAKVRERLHTDFGTDLSVLLEIIATQNTDAESDAPEHVPERHRRNVEQPAGTGGAQASEADVAKIINSLLSKESPGAPPQEEWLRLANLQNLLSDQTKDWLNNASPKEQTVYQTLLQTLTEEVQHLAELRYDSQTQLKEHWHDLKQKIASIGKLTLELDLLESSVKGHLSPKGAYLPGRDIVLGALKHDRLVEFGSLSLRLDLGDGADAILVPLPQLRVFVRRNDKGEEDGVVLWRGHKILRAFPSQQVMFEHLNFPRMRQSLYAEVRPPEMPVPATDANPTPKPLHELVRDNTRLSQWPAVKVALSKLGQKSADWKPEQLQFERYPGGDLREQFEQEAEAFLVEENKRLQRLAANPELASLIAAVVRKGQYMLEWRDENLPTVRAFARTSLTEKLTQGLKRQDVLAPNATVDADAVLITFNGQTKSLTGWGINGYRKDGDDMFASSNNFIGYATIEHTDQAVVRALNSPAGKESLQLLLRGFYAGDDLIKYFEKRLERDDPLGQTFRQLITDWTQQLMQVTLEQARVDGTIDAYIAGEIKTLLDGLLTTTDTGKARLQALLINGKPMPEVLVISVSQRANRERTAEPIRRVYVYWRGPHGAEIVPIASFEKRVKISGADYDAFSALATLSNKHGVEAFQRGHSGARFSTTPIASFTEHVGDQWLLDSIDNTREATTSRHEMIFEQVFKGVQFFTGAACLIGSPVLCAASTLAVMGHDAASAAQHFKRGMLDNALNDALSFALSGVDVLQGVRLFKMSQVLKWAGQVPKSATEMSEAAQTMRRQLDTDFTHSGRLNNGLARRDVTREQLTPLPRPPGKADAGIFYELDGKLYIQDRYQDQVQVYEVYSDNAWATVRVRDPQRPNGYGAPVHYRDGHWRVDDGGLMGGGPVASIFKHQGEQAYMRQFRFPDTPDASRIKDQLKQAFRTKSPPPLAAQHYLIQEKEGWRVFGLAGVPPAGPTRELDGVPELQYFDFSSAPPDHTLKEWFAHDYRDSYTARHGDGQCPDWTLDYVKPEFMLELFDPGKLLSTNKEFPSQKAARAYAEEFDILDKELRKTLITRLIKGEEIADLIEQFPVSARLEAKVQQLVNSHEFADEQAVSDCLKNFSFADTIDGEISRMAFLSAWLKGGRPPVWASDYLKHPLWERYKNSPAKTASQRQDARSSMTVDAGLYESKSAADEYFKNFPLGYENFNEYVREELAMEMLVNPTSTRAWAFDKATDSSKMILYKSKDIPANLENFKVELGEGCETHLRLPEDMPNLLSIDIRIREGAASETKYTVTLPRHAPQLHKLALKNVQFQPSLQLNAQDMPKLKILTITACSETELIDLGKMSGLQEIDISLNAQLSDLHMPEQLPEATSLRISNNPRLPLGAQHIPRELPELRRLFLENNDLREASSVMEGLQAPNLRELDLSGNHLRDLTLPSPGFERLTTLRLAWNDFTTIPQSIMELNPNVDVNLINSRLSAPMQRRYENAMAEAGYSGPILRFDEHDDSAVALARPVSDAVSDWFLPGERVNKKNQWFAHDREVHARPFSAWLDKLHRSRSSDIKAFKDQVPVWIKKLETDDDLRQRSFLLADSATTTCDDRVSLVYNQMQELALLSEATKGLFDKNPEILRSELLKLYYFQEIDKYARIHINKATNKNKYIDEVEVHLLMREVLSDALNLSVPTSNMLYAAAADFTRADKVAALAYISDSEKQGGFYTYLINIKEVITVLEHQFPQEYKLAKKHLDDLVADPNTGPYAEIRDRMLKETGISLDNTDAMAQINRAVMAELEKKYYGPLIDRFFRPTS